MVPRSLKMKTDPEDGSTEVLNPSTRIEGLENLVSTFFTKYDEVRLSLII
jgi:hypothetical protein